MYHRNKKLGAKWLSAILMLICLMLLAGQDVYAQKYKLGDIPLHPEIYKKHLKVWPMEMAEFLPQAYDARSENIVTEAKDQGQCGSCWAFASVGAMESHKLKSYGSSFEDLSEQQQVSCNTSMWGCDGGSSNAIRYWELRGPLYESCFPYTASDSTSCIEAGCVQLDYRVIDWHTVSSSNFKNSLYTYGPSYWRYDVYNDFYTYWSNGNPGEVYVNQAGSTFQGGHAVLLIGWDDAKGAYLCKNSWGATGGPNGDGTFWIAYSGHVNDLGFGMANFSLTALTCSSNSECDDGVYCNGAETCVDGECQDGTPPTCLDDGKFCNGSEVCDESTQGCGHSGNPCGEGTFCNEESDQCESLCGNKVCDEGEDCNSCPNDCLSGSIGGTDCDYCFKNTCDGICHPTKDGPNCPDCVLSWCCGDGLCEGDEDSTDCAVDCGSPPVCGDGTCAGDENQCNCESDCGEPPSTEVNYCSDGVDNDCDGDVDCADIGSCSDDPLCTKCLQKGSECSEDGECCNNKCRGGKCR